MMLRSLPCILTLAALLTTQGCAQEEEWSTGSGARPAVDAPIGPPPGPDPVLEVSGNPFEGNNTARAEGRRLFVWFNCAGCHGDHGGGGMGPSLRDADWLYGNSPAQIFSSIAQGRRHGMPSWGVKLPSDQIWKMVTYIQSLDTQIEPDPPPDNPTWPSTSP